MYSAVRRFSAQPSIPSRGQLAKVIQKVSTAMAESHLALRRMLPGQDILNVDESGHKENGRRLWTWGFRAAIFTCFKIDPSRGSQVLRAVLGEDFAGTLGCDYFSAYHKYRKDSGVSLQFCLAHLIRDVKFLTTLPEAAVVTYGQRMLDGLRRLFHVIHQRETMAAPVFRQALEQARDDLVVAGLDAPEYKPARNMAERFRQNGESYFRFITTPSLVLCHAYKLGLTVGQGVVGAEREGWCMGAYTDDERQSPRPLGPRPAGLAANAPPAASHRLNGSTAPVFAAGSLPLGRLRPINPNL